MDTKIFLQQFQSKSSSNTSEGLDVQLKGRKKLLPFNEFGNVISQYDQYRAEREKCNVIRLTCQVNPICSNVLFNRTSEIIKDEGSSAVTFLNYGIQSDDDCFDNVIFKRKTMNFWSGGSMNYQSTDREISHLTPASDYRLSDIYFDDRYHLISDYNTDGNVIESKKHVTNAIRDTQLSNNDNGFVYHCGLDILNNHLIRSKTFKTVCRCYSDSDDYTDSNYTAFNTIADLMRSVDGKKVVEKLYFPQSESPLRSNNYTKLLAMHLYEYDDICSFYETKQTKLIKKFNGWVGFENSSKIKSYMTFKSNFSVSDGSGDAEMKIERPIMYYNSENFVDMYPNRELYSFVPRYNKFQKRIEKNWNYCITYPSSSYTPSSSSSLSSNASYTIPFYDVIEPSNGINSLKTIYFDENTRADNGVTQLVMHSIAKHGLVVGDFVNIYKTYEAKLYWVSKEITIADFDGTSRTVRERVSKKYEERYKADDEMAMLEEEDKGSSFSIEEGEEVVTHKIIDNAEVNYILDDFTFTTLYPNVQISKYWVYLSDSERDSGGSVEVKMRLSDGSEVTNTYTIDSTRRFYRNSTNLNDENKYYIVNERYVNFDIDAQHISFKKVVSDVECDYYVRIFSKLPNFKFASGDTSNEYEIYKDRGDGTTMLDIYRDKMYDFESHVGNLAFAKNTYTDEIGELVFTDDIDISNIHDNLGRPITSLYLTIIKNNKGYKEWYGFDHNEAWDENEINTEFEHIEYSHCFGKVTCGLETSYESVYEDNIQSINRITNSNIGLQRGYDVSTINGERSYKMSNGKAINITRNEVWYDSDKHFYGDLCYYDSYNCIEKHIQYVNHRFNTAQREAVNSESNTNGYFQTYYYDDIVRDDYDVGDRYEIETYDVNDSNNLMEGYYYNPHYEIPIKTFDRLQSVIPSFLVIREMIRIGDGVYQFTTLEQHFLSVGDKAMLYDILRKKYYLLSTISTSDDNYKVFNCRVYDEKAAYDEKSIGDAIDITYLDSNDDEVSIEYLSTKSTIGNVTVDTFKLFKLDNLDVPSYARVVKDGTCTILWRNVMNNGFNESDKSVEEYPFTNGAFYVNTRIDMYVRRQDPYNEYRLYNESDIEGNIMDITKIDNYVKEGEIIC